MAFHTDDQNLDVKSIFNTINLIFYILFFLEFLIKLIAYGFIDYFSIGIIFINRMEYIRFLVIVFSSIDILLSKAFQIR